ncbi:MAG: NdvB protein [Bacteroidota bacterium]
MELHSPTLLPQASGFLWNPHMMIHMNCRGYAVAQFMQPEPAKYAHAPNLEAKTFMQPEQPYYAHHPGRFCYVKDEENGQLFSVPHEPVRAQVNHFVFSVGKSDIQWTVEQDGLRIHMRLSLAADQPIELWEISVKNTSGRTRKISLYPYFPVGYMSWMNQSGQYDEALQAIICSSITPYQKVADYPKIKTLKDKSFFLAARTPDAWETNQAAFEGEGGLHHPEGIQATELGKGDARYETPTAAMQYRLELAPQASEDFQFAFGPARSEAEVADIRHQLFGQGRITFSQAKEAYAAYVEAGAGIFQIETPDPAWDNFVNHWLPRQIFYHGETNRLTTDPQTRNYLQDNMGMGYLRPDIARQAFLTALSQQHADGAMPDGVLIHEAAELKYINQVPHTDHCVWLPICLKAYLDESDDYPILDEMLAFVDSEEKASVRDHLHRAMQFLLRNRDHRGLSFIEQGDWCDPMNMVGPKGKGVSGWLSLATAYALQVWAEICEVDGQKSCAAATREKAHEVNQAVNDHLWDGQWYARGITDDDVVFGISTDPEGKIFLNPQAWAMLSDTADAAKQQSLIQAVEAQLESPYGVEMLGPPFTAMREDVGRVTQKFPGSAENGSIYNHAAAFYVYALYQAGHADKAWRVMRKMLPSGEAGDLVQRGQMPVFIPNYYRGGYKEFPRTAGRSSQLFNTGTVAWVYRCLIEGMFGVRGTREGLLIDPQLPSDWPGAKITRTFRGCTYQIEFVREKGSKETEIWVDGERHANGALKPSKGTLAVLVKLGDL